MLLADYPILLYSNPGISKEFLYLLKCDSQIDYKFALSQMVYPF